MAHLSSGTATEESIRDLLARGANVNTVDEWGESVLMHAIAFTQDGVSPDLVPVLIRLGADGNHQVDGLGPLW